MKLVEEQLKFKFEEKSAYKMKAWAIFEGDKLLLRTLCATQILCEERYSELLIFPKYICRALLITCPAK